MASIGSLFIPKSPTIRQWEEASTSLVVALGNYANMCTKLESGSLREGATLKDLVSRIDFALEVTHTFLSGSLDWSSSVLARSRNKLASPFFRLPEEVISEIFMNVVFDRDDRKPSPALERECRMVYCRLYNLLGVCTVWRDLIFSRGTLWSVIPIFESNSDKKHRAAKRILQRAGGSPLNLVTSLAWSIPGRLTKILTRWGPQLRSINISAFTRYVIQYTISRLLQHDSPGLLSELSIRFQSAGLANSKIPEESDYIIPRGHPEHASFIRLVGALTAFRVNGAHFQWDIMACSTRLVELRIEQIALGYDDTIAPFVRALSSAPNLRDLKIISISTFRASEATHNQNSSTSVTFPRLESLFLQDLYFNTLEQLLPAIAHGPYRLTLFLTRKSIQNNRLQEDIPGDDEAEGIGLELVEIHSLGSALAGTPVHTLMMSGIWDDCWLTGPELRILLTSMPTLKTLKINNWDLGRAVWRALRRSLTARSHPDDQMFPALENLHFSSARIHGLRGIKNMLVSHPIQGMVLGGVLANRQDESSEWDSCSEDDSITEWLKVNIPGFRLVSSLYEPPEFYAGVWELW